MIKGVNLGNWLVLEKWMSPDLFAGTEAEDETQLCSDLDDVARRERLTVHRDSYVTERDFAYLANRRIDAVRIPVPFFIFGDYPPYLGCIEYARGSEPVPTGFLRDFYTAAYRRIRAQSDDVTIVFHDGFRIREWDGFFTSPQFERIIVDTHLHLMEYTQRTGDESPGGYLGHIRDTLAAWDGAAGWFFWNYKLLINGSDLDGWDLGKSIELGYLPEDLGHK